MAIQVSNKPAIDAPALPTIPDALHASIATVTTVVSTSTEQDLLADGSPAVTHTQGNLSHSPVAGVFKPAVKASRFVLANLANPDYAERYSKCVAHALSWSRSRLQSFYKAEYNSMRSRKQQATAKHYVFDYRLKDFRDWLVHLGPRPAAGWTVHRPNNYKGYQPGNVAWAPKIEQTEVRKVTRWHDLDGKKMTTARLAQHLGLTYTCVYKRLQNGWTIQRLLEDRKKQTGIKAWTFPAKFAHLLEPLYAQRKHYNKSRIDWYIDYMVKQAERHGVSPEYEKVLALLLQEVATAQAARATLLKQQDEQQEQEFQRLVAAFTPMKAEGFG